MGGALLQPLLSSSNMVGWSDVSTGGLGPSVTVICTPDGVVLHVLDTSIVTIAGLNAPSSFWKKKNRGKNLNNMNRTLVLVVKFKVTDSKNG